MTSLVRYVVRIRILHLALLAVLALGAVASGFAQQTPASAPQSEVGTNQQVQLEGELQILYQDFKDHSHLSYSVKQADGTRVPLQFVKHPPTHLLTGDHVQVSGQMSGGSLILYSGSTNVKKTGGGGGPSSCTADSGTCSTSTSSIPLPYTFGPQSTLVILVNFQDDAVQPYSAVDVQNVFFGTASNFFLENSYQQTSLTGNVVGWYTIPVSVATCDISQIASAAQNAATAAGANLSNYSRYVYFFPQNGACAFAGASNVGGNPSQSWINGTVDIHVIDHELGHAFGLWHSHLLDCGTTATICSNGTVVDYGDLVDTMGVPQTASADYNAYQKERLGWLNYGVSPSIQTVTTSGTYTINPYELGGSGPNSLKVLKSTDSASGAKTWYYLEARQAVGFDAFLSSSFYYTQNETTGVLFHVGTDGNGNSSDLIDMTPATPTTTGWWDMSLAAGQSFQDSAAGVTFTTQSISSAGATLNIQVSNNLGPGPGPQSVGALTVGTNQAYYSPGQTVSVTATATNGGSPVANVSVSFSVTNPNGSKVSGSATTGSNGQAVYKLRLKQNAPAGNYVAGAAASACSANTAFTVQ